MPKDLFIITGILATIVIVALLPGRVQVSRDSLIQSWNHVTPQNTPSKDTRKSFYQAASDSGTDKVTSHFYHDGYAKYLTPLRDQKLKFLEIGLGCNMGYGPGASYHLWSNFFSHVDLYFIEYEAACVEKWMSGLTKATVFTGDQANITFLEDFLVQTGGGFDVIIDDGGHTMNQQITSLKHLFKAVVPGGVYFVEDTETSYVTDYGGGPRGSVGSMVEMQKQMLDDLNAPRSGPEQHSISKFVASMECFKEMVVFTKRTYSQMTERKLSIDDPQYVYAG